MFWPLKSFPPEALQLVATSFSKFHKMTFINVKVKALWKVNIKVDWWPSFSSQGFLLQLCQSYQIDVAFSFLDLRWTACFAMALEHLMLQKKKLQTWAKNWWDYTCVAKVTRVTVILSTMKSLTYKECNLSSLMIIFRKVANLLIAH